MGHTGPYLGTATVSVCHGHWIQVLGVSHALRRNRAVFPGLRFRIRAVLRHEPFWPALCGHVWRGQRGAAATGPCN